MMYSLKNFEPRLYQQTILGTCSLYNTLVVLPTGMGKTAIAMLLGLHRLSNYPNSKILLLAPTKPLAQQHLATFKDHVDAPEEKFVLFTGEIGPEKRAKHWEEAVFVFSTPQGLENDIISNKISLKDVSLLIFDEAHRASGEYSYNFIAKQYNSNALHPRILALTASPGSDMEKINEVCTNLYIEEIEVRTEEDKDVERYVQEVEAKWISVDLPEEFLNIKRNLEECKKSKIKTISSMGEIGQDRLSNMTKKEFLGLQAAMHAEIRGSGNDPVVFKTISLLAEILKIDHATELLETQGISALNEYFEKMWAESKITKTKALKNLVEDMNFKAARIKCHALNEKGVEHPKIHVLKKLIAAELANNPEAKIIVFNQYRDSVIKIKKELDELEIKTKIFVGQAKKKNIGLSQKDQKKILEEFSRGEFNILLSTSVGEEGIDIPKVDIVIFYEPIPSAIRHIQRRGRTGRLEEGKLYVLMAKNTRDVHYRWSAYHKEKRMYRALEELKKKALILKKTIKIKSNKTPDISLESSKANQGTNTMPNNSRTEKPAASGESISGSKIIGETVEKDNKKEDMHSDRNEEAATTKYSKIKMFADHREKNSGVLKELIEEGVQINLQQLRSGDYILSERVGIEFKTVQDFVNSIVDGRLLSQIKELKENFEKPIIIIEGNEDIYSQRSVHPNAIRGMITTILLNYGIPIIRTTNAKETAGYMLSIARREQEEEIRHYSMHGDKKPITQKELQEYFISSLPGVGPGLAKPLLKKFGSVKRILNAEEKELRDVELIGEKKARKIKEFVEKEYED